MIKKERNKIVVASLEFGRYLTGTLLILVWFGFSLGLAIFLGAILVTLISLDTVWINDYLLSEIVPVIILAILELSLMSYYLLRRRKIKQKIKLWMKDSVELNAYSRIIDKLKIFGHPVEVKIEVRFEHNGLTFVKQSISRDKIFRYFADREIKILYSPMYKQVMILKD